MCMSRPEAAETAVSLLKDDDFDGKEHKSQPLSSIFKAIVSIVNRGKRAAPPMVAEEIRRLGLAQGTNLAPVLTELMRTHTGSGDVTDYCKTLRRYTTRRRIRMLGLAAMDIAADDKYETEEDYWTQVESLLTEQTLKTNTSLVQMGDVIAERMQEHIHREKGDFIGLRTGFVELDDRLCGMRGGDYIVIAARPGVGKTTLAEDIANHNAMAGKTVIFVAKEMREQQLADRAIAAVGGVNSGMLRAGLVDKDRLKETDNKLRAKFGGKPYFIDRFSKTVGDIRRNALRIKRTHGLDLLLIDYLQLMSAGGKYARSGNRTQEVGEISRDIKGLAIELLIPIIVLSQLSRSVESRKDDKRPELSDLRETGDIEQDSDVVAMLYRDNYYNPESKDGSTEVIIRKNRNGPLGTVVLEFVGERTTFLNPTRK